MNIIVAAGSGFEVPYDGDFLIRIATPFTAQELATQTLLLLHATAQNGTLLDLNGAVDGTDVTWLVPAQTFFPGLWELNPKIIVGGRRFGFALAVGMNVLADGVSRWPQTTPTYTIQ